MKKNSIKNVPMYFEPFVNDCFANAVSSLMQYKGINPSIVLSDYLCFMYDHENGYIGMNYLIRPLVIEPKEEECCTSYEFVNLPSIVEHECIRDFKPAKDRISLVRCVEDDSEKAYGRVKELIDCDTPAIVAVDLHYIKYHRAYQKEHGLHNIVITGYDEEEGYFEVFDKYRLSGSNFEGKLPIDEVNQARSSQNPGGNIWVGDDASRPVRNLSIEMLVGEDFEITKEKIANIIQESCIRMKSGKRIINNECGIRAFDLFIGSLREKQAEGLTSNNQYYFREYLRDALKQISRSRIRFNVFLEQTNAGSEELLAACKEYLLKAAKDWDIVSNLSYKMTVTKKLETIDTMCEKLENIKDTEMKFVDFVGLH